VTIVPEPLSAPVPLRGIIHSEPQPLPKPHRLLGGSHSGKRAALQAQREKEAVAGLAKRQLLPPSVIVIESTATTSEALAGNFHAIAASAGEPRSKETASPTLAPALPAAVGAERLARNYLPLKLTESGSAALLGEAEGHSATGTAGRGPASPAAGADGGRSSTPPPSSPAAATAGVADPVAAREVLFAALGNSPAAGLADLSVQPAGPLAASPAFTAGLVALADFGGLEAAGGVLLSDAPMAQVDSQAVGGQRTSGPEWALVFTPLMGPSRGRERQQPTIVVVDSDEKSRDAITVKLVQEGFLVMPAASGRDALNVARIPLSPIDVVLLDLHLPDVSAVQVLQRLQQFYLKMPAVVCTGTPSAAELQQLSALGVKRTLPKPVELDSLVATIRTLVRSN
jgi:CheY-like chemotaxis protein